MTGFYYFVFAFVCFFVFSHFLLFLLYVVISCDDY